MAKIPYRNCPHENLSVLDVLWIEYLAQKVLAILYYARRKPRCCTDALVEVRR